MPDRRTPHPAQQLQRKTGAVAFSVEPIWHSAGEPVQDAAD
jgi:hypothetical protein